MEIHIEEKDIRAIGENPRLLRAFAEMIVKASEIDLGDELTWATAPPLGSGYRPTGVWIPGDAQPDPLNGDEKVMLSRDDLLALRSNKNGFRNTALAAIGIKIKGEAGWLERAIGKVVLKTDYQKALLLRNKKLSG